MNARKKENDEVTPITESLSSDTPKKPRSKHLSRIVKPVLITILAMICLSGGIVLHKIHNIETQRILSQKNKVLKYERQIPSHISKTKNTTKPVVPFKEIISSIEQPAIHEASISSIHTPSDEPIVDQSQVEENPPSANEEAPLNVQEQPKMDGFSLADAILFKEHFLTEESCFDDYQKLLNASNKTILARDVLNNLSPYCLSNQSAIKNVREAFLKNKKNALIVYYKENNPNWLAYLKAIPAILVEIRKINPTNSKPKDILYRAQNEINSQNISKAIDLITKLPLSMQQKMTDFYREAAIYNRAKNSIDQLILSFEVKGE